MKLPTERECSNCETANYVETDGDIMCPNCYHTTEDRVGMQSLRDDPWESWWSHRQQYSGFHGEDRVRMVGGFTRPYIE